MRLINLPEIETPKPDFRSFQRSGFNTHQLLEKVVDRAELMSRDYRGAEIRALGYVLGKNSRASNGLGELYFFSTCSEDASVHTWINLLQIRYTSLKRTED